MVLTGSAVHRPIDSPGIDIAAHRLTDIASGEPSHDHDGRGESTIRLTTGGTHDPARSTIRSCWSSSVPHPRVRMRP